MELPFPTAGQLVQLVKDELILRREWGCDTAALEAERAGIDPHDRAGLLELWQRVCNLSPPDDLTAREPDDLAGIQAQRPAPATVAVPRADFGNEAIADRIHGGWLGRCAGLVLGKPAEHSPFMHDPRKLRTYLQAADAYPLRDYIPEVPEAYQAAEIDVPMPFPASQRGNIQFVESDDDIRYTIMGLETLERRGAAFTTADVARWWTHRLPAAMLFTAEEAAYRNLMLRGAHFEPHKLPEDQWRVIATDFNPYREWIGAQIRADGWALACPGDPQRAADFAWRDARLSHTQTGIYGEMYCAALIAAALTLEDPAAVVQAGLGKIPAEARLSQALRDTVARCQAVRCDAAEFEGVLEWLWDQFGHYHAVHTINNAAAVTAAVLLGRGDFEQTITIAVSAGWDSDCNGATAGCVCGALRGAAALPEKWTRPLHDTLYSEIPGFHPIAISECARRQTEVARRLATG